MATRPAQYLWASNDRQLVTGYGNQTNLFVPTIKRTGREIAIFAFYGREGCPIIDQDGILTLPRMEDQFGNDIAYGHYQYMKADIMLSLIDPCELDTTVYGQMNWCAWTPIDSTPALPRNVTALKSARWIWSMSQHGHRQLRAAGLDPIYVPHGIDTELFKPIDRQIARQHLGTATHTDLTGKFVVMCNAANRDSPSRKGFYETFAAFKSFSDSHPDALLYMHTRQINFGRGENLAQIAELVDLDPQKVIYAPQYELKAGILTQEYLNEAYNAADLFFSTAHGEGSGIPVVEAQAAGCPVLVTDCSALSELVLSGQKIPGVTYMPQPGITWQRPLVAKAAELLSWAYDNRDNAALRTKAREGALDYDYHHVFQKYMLPALMRMESELFADRE